MTNTNKTSGADVDRDIGGRIVREAWVRWALTQPNPKPSWLVPYDKLSEPDKEADRQIHEACVAALTAEREALAAEVKAQAKQIADFDGLSHAWRRHCDSMKENEDRYLWLKARMDASMIQMIVNIEPDDKDEISQQVEASIDAARASAATG